MVKNPPASAGDARDMGSISGSKRSPGLRNGNPLQYSCLENSMVRGASYAIQPMGLKELDRIEHTHRHTHVSILQLLADPSSKLGEEQIYFIVRLKAGNLLQ